MGDDKPFNSYYKNQAGTGIAGHSGLRHQRGHGFWGNLYNMVIKPFGSYLGKQALTTGVAVGNDILQGENFKESAKKRIKSQGKIILGDAIERAKKFAQTGQGKRRRRKRKKTAKKLKIKAKKSKSKKINKKKPKKRKSVRRKKSKRPVLSHLF
jgi:hypothetical protein